MLPKGWHVTPPKWAWLWSRDRFFLNFAVCRDAARRAGFSVTAESLFMLYWPGFYTFE